MDVIKYRQIYLKYNWGQNHFDAIKQKVDGMYNVYNARAHGINHPFLNHPLVLSGQAFWLNNNELCIGYELNTHPGIFRPIFSHKRQRLLDGVHSKILNPYRFWNRIKRRYFYIMSRIKNLPLECVKHIVKFTY